MPRRAFTSYMVAVVSYFRMEWSLAAEGEAFEVSMTKDMETLLRECMRLNVSVPNAARDVRTLMDLQSEEAGR